VQGQVEAGGKRGRLDQIVGQGWVLLGYDTDPATALTEEQRHQLARLDGITLRLCGPSGTGEVIDVEGTIGNWLHRIGARYVLIRPDFYVAVTADTPEQLQARFTTVMQALYLTEAQAIAAE
jgi:hypothetical protein